VWAKGDAARGKRKKKAIGPGAVKYQGKKQQGVGISGKILKKVGCLRLQDAGEEKGGENNCRQKKRRRSCKEKPQWREHYFSFEGKSAEKGVRKE